MRIGRALAFVLLACAVGASPAFAEIQLSIQNGQVTLLAKDATVRQILTEWARRGQTRIVNIERIPGGVVTLQLSNVPEQQAIDILLRSVSGYVLAPRPVPAANLSRFDRIIVMPTSVAPRAVAPQLTPAFRQRAPDEDDDQPAANNPALQPPRGPVFNAFPQPQVVDPAQVVPTTVTGGAPQGQPPAAPAAPATTPGSVTPGPATFPPGTRSPGMIVQPPPQSSQPGAPPPPSPEGN